MSGELGAQHEGRSSAAAPYGPPPHDRAVAASVQEILGARYEVLGLVGEGPVGMVFGARDRETGEALALKLLSVGPDDAMVTYERARQLARMASAVAHRRVVVPAVAAPTAEAIFCTMPLLPAGSLHDLTATPALLPFERIVEILTEVAAILDQAHERQVVHGAVKPTNILFDVAGAVHLTDFSISAIFADARSPKMDSDAYVAPEQWRGQRVGPRADQYSLGIVAHELITGQRRADALNVEGIAVLDPLEVSSYGPLRPELGMHVNVALATALSASPANRFPTVTDFVNALAGRSGTAAAVARGAADGQGLGRQLVILALVVAASVGAVAAFTSPGVQREVENLFRAARADVRSSSLPDFDLPSPRSITGRSGGISGSLSDPGAAPSVQGTMGGGTGGTGSTSGTGGVTLRSLSSGLPGGSSASVLRSSGSSGRTPGVSTSAAGTGGGTARTVGVGGSGVSLTPSVATTGTSPRPAGAASDASISARVRRWLSGDVLPAGAAPATEAGDGDSPEASAALPGTAVTTRPRAAASQAAPTSPGLREASGYLRVSAAGGTPVVLIDGVARGTAPLVARVAPGRHAVEVRSFGSRYTPGRRAVGVSDRDTVTLEFLRVPFPQ